MMQYNIKLWIVLNYYENIEIFLVQLRHNVLGLKWLLDIQLRISGRLRIYGRKFLTRGIYLWVINGKSCDWMNKVGDNCLEFCPNGTLTHKDERARRWQKKMSSISQWI